MMKRMPLARTSLVLAGLLSLSACSTIGQLTGQTESIEYKSTVTGDPLSIPPDLTQANKNTHYVAPEGVARLSDYQASQGAQSATPIISASNTRPIQASLFWLKASQRPPGRAATVVSETALMCTSLADRPGHRPGPSGCSR